MLTIGHMQIGLVDVLREEYGITPGGVLGHSAGEIACGYGDGCFTREQTVLVAYHRGRMCPEHNISGGLMAAVGLGAEEAEARLVKHGKDSCVVGCDNSPNSVTLSGIASNHRQAERAPARRSIIDTEQTPSTSCN